MEAQWQADRSALRDFLQTRPDLTLKEIAKRVGRSYGWAKKWAKRFSAAPPDDLAVLVSHSRAHKMPYPAWEALVFRRIEQIRLLPPEGLQRTPGRHPPLRIIYLVMLNCRREVVDSRVRRAPSGSCSPNSA